MRSWTVDEARAYLPRLRELVGLIDAALVPGPEPGTRALPAGSEHAEAAIAELHSGGIVLRQLGVGLVDFPWHGPDGEIRLLCYRLTELRHGDVRHQVCSPLPARIVRRSLRA